MTASRAGAGVSAALLLLIAGSAGAEPSAPEPALAALVASAPGATVAVLPAGGWQVELATLVAGDVDPAVAPDGRRIAFASERTGNYELFVGDARTSVVRRLTRNVGAVDRRPAWSPDGRRIVWESIRPGGADLFVMRADGSGKRRLVGETGDDSAPAWSPDGRRVAFSSNRGGRRQLWAVASTGGEPEQITDVPGRAHSPAWAPGGGRRLAFVVESARDASVWVLELEDGSVQRLTRGPGRDSRPDWSPAGEHIAFTRVSAGRSAIWVTTAHGGRARQIEGTEGLTDPDWVRTDRSLVPRPDERLPDLDQRAPDGLVVVQAGRRFHLGFASATENRGVGPLVINGHRRRGRVMAADQVVERRGGAGGLLLRDVGRLRYEPHAPHYHWHLKSFVSYELQRARDSAVIAHDGKSGFCLIDRWGRVLPRVPGSGPPRFLGDCATGQPEARTVVLGTSVGYVDRYPAFFHGQELDLTGLPAGRYLLVHRANPERTMRELRYSNNGAAVLLELAWPRGRSSLPRLAVVRRCPSDVRCGM